MTTQFFKTVDELYLFIAEGNVLGEVFYEEVLGVHLEVILALP